MELTVLLPMNLSFDGSQNGSIVWRNVAAFAPLKDKIMKVLDSSPDREIVNTRIVAFSRGLVFRAWSDSSHLRNWYGPKGFSCDINIFEFRIGGRWSFVLHGPDQGHYPNECVFLEIVEPRLLAWDHVSQPQFQVVVELDEVSPKQTKVTFRMVFKTAEECAKIRTFAPEKNEENLDRLEAELSRMEQGT